MHDVAEHSLQPWPRRDATETDTPTESRVQINPLNGKQQIKYVIKNKYKEIKVNPISDSQDNFRAW